MECSHCTLLTLVNFAQHPVSGGAASGEDAPLALQTNSVRHPVPNTRKQLSINRFAHRCHYSCTSASGTGFTQSHSTTGLTFIFSTHETFDNE